MNDILFVLDPSCTLARISYVLKKKLVFDIDENDFSVCNLGFMYIYQHGDVFIVCYNYFEMQQQFVVIISYFDGSPDILYADYLGLED